jgi:uncharacterized protein YndB with AHSA1/START domain
MNITIAPAPVVKSIRVAAAPDRAFDVFTRGMGSWWLKTHSIAKTGQVAVTVEPRAGGRWFETGAGGEQCDWGNVEIWEPPHHVRFIWTLNADWTTDPPVRTELDVTFTPDGSGTLVRLVHSGLEAHAHRAAEVRASLDSDGGWSGLMAAFAEAAA